MRYVPWVALAAGLIGCGPSVQVQAYSREPGLVVRGEVQVFQSPTVVQRRYRVIALIVAEGTNRGEQELLAAARRKARSIGAEGVILLRQEVTVRGAGVGESQSLGVETRRVYAAAIRFMEPDPNSRR
ncbi:MAG: hypothetical protein HY560_14515 [Gemmatimonadetes bacterium]|nr:hypothetical protein [Gemmatimonadota bacterium]